MHASPEILSKTAPTRFPRPRLLAIALLLLFASLLRTTTQAAAPQAPSASNPPPTTPPPPTTAAPDRPTLVGEPIKRPSIPYTLKITDKSPANAKGLSPLRPASALLVRSKTIQLERMKSVDGKGHEIWSVGPLSFIGDPDGETVRPFSAGGDFSLANLVEFSWIRKELYRGTITLGSDQVLIFMEDDPEEIREQEMQALVAQVAAQQAAEAEKAGKPAPKTAATKQAGAKGAKAAPAGPQYPPGPFGGIPMKPGIHVAAVDEKTRLPKYIQFGQEIRMYEFGVPTPEDLTIPPKVARMMQPAQLPKTPAQK